MSQTDASLVGSEIGACESISKASWLEDGWVSQSGAFLVGSETDACESISGVSWIKGWVLQSRASLVGFETGAWVVRWVDIALSDTFLVGLETDAPTL